MTDEPEIELTMALVALTSIARSPCRQPCAWDTPCHACFAGSILDSITPRRKCKGWRKFNKIVPTAYALRLGKKLKRPST